MNQNKMLNQSTINNDKNTINNSEINELKLAIIKIYRWSFASTIALYIEIFVIAFLVIYVVTAKSNNLTTNYNQALLVISKIIVTIESIRILLLIILLIMIFISKNKTIKSELMILAIASLFPGISFFTFFFLKRKIKKIYIKSLDFS